MRMQLLALPLLVCTSLAAPPGGARAPGDEAEARRRAIAAIDRGALEEARDVLGSILIERYRETAAALLAADNPEDGLLWVDRALALDRAEPRVLFLQARGSLQLADRLAARGGAGLHVESAYRDALAAFTRAARSSASLLGASRAAHMLGDSEQALAFAREAIAELDRAPSDAEAFLSPERTWAEAAFAAYTRARAAEPADAEAPAPAAEAPGGNGRTPAAARSAAAPGDGARRSTELFQETEEALQRMLGASSDDPWVWTTLANLYSWEARPDDALSALERGLDRVPSSRALIVRLREVAGSAGSGRDALATLARFTARHPDVALGYLELGRARFDAELDALLASSGDPERFRAAEGELARARQLDPSLEHECRSYEVMCRDAVGWCLFHAGELEAAAEAFASMEAVLERGMQWHYPGRLLSGVEGLRFVGDAYNKREDWEGAAQVFDRLHAYEPENATWANNAGFFNRDAGVEQEFLGARLCRASRGEVQEPKTLDLLRARAGVTSEEHGTAAERGRFVRAANAAMERARELMERSYRAYLDAARLAPLDVRIVNDTALVLVYYLHRDLDLAKEHLLRAIRLGEEQLAAPGLEEDARWELENAWGDAYQNLGVMLLVHEKDPNAARAAFAKCVEIGPEPRPVVRDLWLKKCDGIDVVHPESLAPLEWARPCAPTAATTETGEEPK